MLVLRALELVAAFAAITAPALAQNHTSEESEAQITGLPFLLCASRCSLLTFVHTVSLPADPNLECTPYYYAPSASHIPNLPPVWQPATLLANDSAGQALWSKIAGNIPNISPKGQLNGSTINVTYDNVNDPDCCESFLFALPPPFGSDSRGWRG